MYLDDCGINKIFDFDKREILYECIYFLKMSCVFLIFFSGFHFANDKTSRLANVVSVNAFNLEHRYVYGSIPGIRCKI